MWFYSHHSCMRGSDTGVGAEYRVLVTGKMVTCLKMKKKMVTAVLLKSKTEIDTG